MDVQKERELFSRPLIIGASISAGYGTRNGGPGEVLSRLINPDAKITNLARNGASSIQSTAHLDLTILRPTLIMGLDLFFWDAARNQVGTKFETNTRRFFKDVQSRGIPMIIAKLPIVDLPFGKKAEDFKRNAILVNSLLDEFGTMEQNTLLYDPVACLLSMDFAEHFSESFHLTCEGNEFCARYLHESGLYRQLSNFQKQEIA